MARNIVGTKVAWVMPLRSISAITSAATKRGRNTWQPAACVTENNRAAAATWNSGPWWRWTVRSDKPSSETVFAVLAMKLAWLSMTPLAALVVPLV